MLNSSKRAELIFVECKQHSLKLLQCLVLNDSPKDRPHNLRSLTDPISLKFVISRRLYFIGKLQTVAAKLSLFAKFFSTIVFCVVLQF